MYSVLLTQDMVSIRVQVYVYIIEGGVEEVNLGKMSAESSPSKAP